MLLRYFSLILFLFLSLQSYSQIYKKVQLDSLKNKAAKSTGRERVKALLDLSNAYIWFQSDTARLFVNLAKEESIEQDYKWGFVKAIF